MNFLDVIFKNLNDRPDLTTVIEIHGRDRKPFDGRTLLDLVSRARNFIAAAGVQSGDRVALLAPNSARWVAADLALLANGAAAVPLYDRQEPSELAVMLRNSEPRLLIAATRELADAVAEAWPEHCRLAVFDEVFAADPADASRHEHAEEDTVAIIYTSGTSGEPKGVMLSRANVDFMIPRTIERLDRVVRDRGGPDEVFHFLPFCFAAARIMLWTQLSRPNPIMISTDLTNLVEEMGTARPHYFLSVPAVLERIRSGVTARVRERGGVAWSLFDGGFEAYRSLESGQGGLVDRIKLALATSIVYRKIKAQIGPDLEFLISGSAPLSEDTQNWFRMIGIDVYQAYGLTETTGIVSLDEPDKVVPGRVGYPLTGIEARVSEDGELLVRGPNIFAGYWKKSDETEKAMVAGWFHTGDQVDIVDGNIRIIGRLKNLIIPESGHNIAPEPIEEKFMEYCSEAQQCMLVGHGKPFIGVLVTGNPPPPAVAAAIERVNAEVPHYRKIRKYHLTEEPFTVENGLLTANQKLRRRVIEDHFKTQIDALYAS